MKKLTLIALIASLFSLTVHAHPGRTASDGCHYCRTNCAAWGVPHGQRHCHGGGLKPESQIEVMKSAAGNSKKREELEVTHTHGEHGTHTHKKEMYN